MYAEVSRLYTILNQTNSWPMRFNAIITTTLIKTCVEKKNSFFLFWACVLLPRTDVHSYNKLVFFSFSPFARYQSRNAYNCLLCRRGGLYISFIVKIRKFRVVFAQWAVTFLFPLPYSLRLNMEQKPERLLCLCNAPKPHQAITYKSN